MNKPSLDNMNYYIITAPGPAGIIEKLNLIDHKVWRVGGYTCSPGGTYSQVIVRKKEIALNKIGGKK